MTRVGSLTTEIVDAYSRGQTIIEIAERLGIGQGSVWRTLRAEGVERRPHGLRKPTIVMPNDPAVLGYLAGLFDGEGSLQFKEKHERRSLGCKLGIFNTNEEVHEWLVATVGGHVQWRTDRYVKRGWQPCGTWELYRAADVCLFLQGVRQYVIIKRDTVNAALELFDHFGLPSGNARQSA